MNERAVLVDATCISRFQVCFVVRQIFVYVLSFCRNIKFTTMFMYMLVDFSLQQIVCRLEYKHFLGVEKARETVQQTIVNIHTRQKFICNQKSI